MVKQQSSDYFAITRKPKMSYSRNRESSKNSTKRFPSIKTDRLFKDSAVTSKAIVSPLNQKGFYTSRSRDRILSSGKYTEKRNSYLKKRLSSKRFSTPMGMKENNPGNRNLESRGEDKSVLDLEGEKKN